VKPANPFGPGEELVFQVKVLGAKSGTARFSVGSPSQVEERLVWPITMQAQSQGLTDRLYPIRDRFVSLWDPVTRLPVEGRLTADEGRKKRAMSIRFRRDSGEPARAEVVLEGAGGTETFAETMDRSAQDLQSAVYWLRTRPLQAGERDEVPIVAGKRQWAMGAEVIGPSPIKTPAGKFEAVLVRVATSFAGKLQSQQPIAVYFSADARHLPLRIEADLLLGKLTAELVSFELGTDVKPEEDHAGR